jgi:hypothetical protein
MRRVAIGLALLILAAAPPAFAQVSSGAPTTGVGSVWETGTSPTLYTGRETPNLLPAAQSGPVGNQPASPPSAASSVGIPWAGGMFYGGGNGGTFYDDNVFATNATRLGDWAFFERPEAAWVKQGQNYTFSTDGFVEGREYATYSSEDQVNGSVGANLTVMPDNNSQVVASARYLHEHLDRGSSETVISPGGGAAPVLLSTLFTHPVAYDEGIETLAINKRYGNWWTSTGVAGLEISYTNPTIGSMFGVTPFTGDAVNLGYADGLIGTANGRVGYVVAPLTSVFVEAVANSRNWGVSYFTSTGYRVVAGMLFEQGPGARLKGEFWAGYMDQNYSGATLQAVSTWTYGVDLSAVVTNDLTAVVQGRREAKESALGLATLSPGVLGVSDGTCSVDVAVCVSAVESSAGARLDYRILPKVVIGGGMTYLEDDYQGPLAFGRVDRSYGPLASVKYFATPNLTLGFDYHNLSFTSTGGAAPAGFTPVDVLPFYKDVFIFSVSGRY